MKLLLECSALILPALLFKLWRDRNGTIHPDILGALWVSCIMMVSAILVSTYEYYTAYPGSWQHLRLVNIKSLAVAITGYGLIFPLAFNFMWWNRFLTKDSPARKNKTIKDQIYFIVNHLSKIAFPDKLYLKYGIHWAVRLAIYLTLFIGSLTWFVWNG